jgi:aromatic ring-cleaving dioxygenase
MTDQSNPQIAGYHAHVYYDPMTTRPAAERLAEEVAGNFAVKIGGLFDKPVGPHPVANLQIIFAPDEFARLVPWLMLNRNGLDVLVHPLTADAARDHDADGLWLGTQLQLRPHTHSRDYAPELLPTA